uniref:Uncharacterized protein LOC117346323 n=1 Tax=Geotrypetes seraphini TaxID=260995 RepID=A0A6P8NLZ3_GEOSA|nr:uncharacterized protein LOC117346323 [Geotrypetes seraphini]
MAAANPAESLQEEASCPICLDYFTDPVLLDCGHNYCRSCITQTWEGRGTNFPCPQCRETSLIRNLRPNRQLANITEIAKKLSRCSVRPKEEDPCAKDEGKPKLFYDEAMEQHKKNVKMHMKPLRKKLEELLKFKFVEEKKAEELKSETELKRQKAETEFEELNRLLNGEKQILLSRLEEEEKKILQRIRENVTRLEGKITSLTQLISETEEKPLQEVKKAVSRFQKMKFPEPEAVSIDLKMGFQLSYPLQLKKLAAAFANWWTEYGRYAVNVTLDPETAHPDLVLSECRTGVKRGETREELPDNPERFDTEPYVLGCEGFTSGRHYWEVEVGDWTSWIVGVCKDSVRRKGRILPSPREGYWSVALWEEGKYSALTSPMTDLCLKPRAAGDTQLSWDEELDLYTQDLWDEDEYCYNEDLWDTRKYCAFSYVPPKKGPRSVGILLEYEAGKVSFYNAKNKSLLFTFTDTFTEKLRPFFSTDSKQKGSEIGLSHLLHTSVPRHVFTSEAFLAFSESFKVIGPDQPVFAVLGEDAVLPCRLSPALSAEHMQVRWYRTKFKVIVHLYENGMDQTERQIPEYRGRTELITNYISCGGVSLRIHNIGPDDEGSYTCFFQFETFEEEATLELKVGDTFFHWDISCMFACLFILLVFGAMLVLDYLKKQKQEKECLQIQLAHLHIQHDFLRTELEFRRCCSYAVNVSLDLKTAHPFLILSEDQKSVRWGNQRQNLPDNPQRFDTIPCVLGCQRFGSGRHYWEVEVEGESDWILGVCNDLVRKKGHITMSPEEGYWAVRPFGTGCSLALTSPETLLSLPEKPWAVVILLDYGAGKVSFYNAGNKSHIYTFTHTFTGKLRPFFCTFSEEVPLRIRQVAGTGSGYIKLLKKFLESAERYFVKGGMVKYYVCTDRPDEVKALNLDIKRPMKIIKVPEYSDWNQATMGRMEVIKNQTELLFHKELDYLVCIDTDIVMLNHIGVEILGELIVYAERFKVIGPGQPMVAVVGEDVVLPCRLNPVLSAERMQVRWFRNRFDLVVHLYENGMDQDEQIPVYRGRTELIRNDISCGSVSLRIYNIRLDDAGSYTCFFRSDTHDEEATLELKVASLGSAPSISVNNYWDKGIRVLYESAGWFPEPEVIWRQEGGQNLTSLSETETQRQNDLFNIKTSLLIRRNEYSRISCSIRNTILNQKREAAISIEDTFFHQVSCWVSSLSIILSMIFPCSLLVVLVISHSRKERREKEALRIKLEWTRYGRYAVNVTLDPETAQPWLILSEDRKSVKDGNTKQKLPDNPQRFDPCPCVLGFESFTSGRHYWEVEVGDKTDWDLGVCKDSVNRKGKITLTPEEGYWVMWLRNGDEYKALTSPNTLLPLSVRPRAVGIFLDYEAGKVSFYNADNKSHLFTFTNTFSEKLHPYFSPFLNLKGKHAGALKIRPVPDWE